MSWGLFRVDVIDFAGDLGIPGGEIWCYSISSQNDKVSQPRVSSIIVLRGCSSIITACFIGSLTLLGNEGDEQEAFSGLETALQSTHFVILGIFRMPACRP